MHDELVELGSELTDKFERYHVEDEFDFKVRLYSNEISFQKSKLINRFYPFLFSNIRNICLAVLSKERIIHV